jgi:molecular chaperone GrpE
MGMPEHENGEAVVSPRPGDSAGDLAPAAKTRTAAAAGKPPEPLDEAANGTPESAPPAGEARTPAGEAQTPAGEAQAPAGEAQAPAGEAQEDAHHQLERDLEELTAKAEKADQYLELAQRTKADFENYRKRAAREAAAAQERGIARLAKELLPAVDSLDRALAAAEGDNGSATLASGIKLVQADVIAALARAGIEPFSPEGQPFDPQHHEAVAQQPVEGAQPGTVVEVYQRGYRFGDSVLRPARVVVAG